MPISFTFRRFFLPVLIIFSVFAFSTLVPQVAHADATINVTTLTDTDTNDGLCSLREAITAANNNANYNGCTGSGAYGNDTITFDSTTFNPGTITLGSALPNIITNINITGLGTDKVIVDGVNLYQPFFVASGTTVTISSLTITHGLGNTFEGGGAVDNQGTLTIRDSVLTQNNSNINLDPFITQGGGAIFNSGVLTLDNTTLSNNTAPSFTNGGGGIFSSGGTVSLSRSTLSNNTAPYGGGIYTNNTPVILRDTTLSDNTSAAAGGGFLIGGGNTLIVNSTLSGNTANTFGGAIETFSGNLTLINSTVAGNSTIGASGGGGALDLFGGGATLIINSTLAGNSAASPNQATSGIWLESGPLTLQNTIVADNGAGTNNCHVTGGSITDAGHNLDNGSSCGFGGTVGQNTNPLLGGLQNNGGLTQTIALGAGSPAINAGNNTLAVDENSAALTTDQRGAGFPRIVGSTVDIGAYEAPLTCPTFPHTVAASDVTDLIFSITCANTNGTGTDDVINLTNSTYTLTVANNATDGGNGLPVILDAATAGTLTINGSGATITRSSAGGTPNFRIFEIADAGSLTLNTLIISNGALTSVGGSGILNAGGTFNLNGSTVSGNTSTGIPGGGLENTGGTTTITNSTFSGNTGNGSGAIGIAGGAVNVLSSTLSGNTATNGIDGSAVFGAAGTALNLVNSTVTNNVGPNTLVTQGTAHIINSTIVNNTNALSPALNGFGITLDNSIVANNSNGDCSSIFGNFIHFTLIGDGSCIGTAHANGNLFGAPGLGTLTGSPAYYPLTTGSIAINSGSNALTVDPTNGNAALTTDQRGAGFPRVVGIIVDMGAFESPTLCTSFPHTVASGDVSDLIFSINCANNNGAGTDDVINLTNSTYTLTGVSAPSVGLPAIVDATADGTLIINGNGATITRDSGAPQFHHFLLNAGANLTLNDLTLSGGSLISSTGGAIANQSATLAINNSLLTGNSASNAGAIYNNGGAITISNSTLSGNSTSVRGGAIINQAGTLTLTNSTLSGNSATIQAGGIYAVAGTISLGNTILAGNSAPSGADFGGAGTITSLGYNLIGDGTGVTITGTTTGNLVGSTVSPINPQLGVLGNNGGLSQTMALQTGSPAINAGDPAFAPPPSTDQRGTGFPRVNDFVVDIGAVESAALCPTFPAIINSGDEQGLIDAINCANGNGAGTNDVINLTNSTYTLTAVNNAANGGSGLPAIVAQGTAGTLTINGNGATITRDSGAPNFRILRLSTGANLTIDQVTISNGNLSSSSGGGILNQGTLTVTNSTFSGNSGLNGGGISTAGGSTLTVTNSTFSGNTTFNVTGEGGAIFNAGTAATISNSTFSGNVATTNGGAIHTQAPMTVINSTFSGNSSPASGGGIFATGSTLTVTNSTFSDNTAPSGGSGIYKSSGTLNLNNSIVANSLSSNDCLNNIGSLNVSHTLIEDGSCGVGTGPVYVNGNLSGDPLLGSLQDNGGLTQTMVFGAGSPALDTGSNALAVDATSAPLDFDQRGTGFPRVNDYVVDMGAIESPAICPTFPHTVAASDVADLILSITCANSNGTGTDDEIDLTNSTYTLTAVNNSDGFGGDNGLPQIIDASLQGTLTIKGNGATITRSSAGGTPQFRFFYLNPSANLTLDGLTLSNGNSDGTGGGVLNDGGTLTVTNSTFSSNSTPGGTGGAIASVGTATVTNSTFSGNSAVAGGGIDNENTLTVTNSTFSGNSASGIGGADIYNGGISALNNSIFANSTSGSDCYTFSGAVNARNSLFEDDLSCVNGTNSNNLTGDPGLDPAGLQNNGGSTQTIALETGSSAVNKGSNALIPGSVTTDQRGTGFARIVDTTVDMGAYEVQSLPALLSATKTASGSLVVGSTVTYTVTITNTGVGDQADNTGHEFSDTLPSELTLVSANPTSGTTGITGNTVSWDGSLAATNGSVTITVTATINAGTTGQTVSNQGTVSYDSDGNNTNDATTLTDDPGVAGTSDPTVFTVTGPDISITKTASDVNGGNLVPGDVISYEIEVANDGDADGTSAVLTETIPANTTFDAADSDAGWTCNPDGNAGSSCTFALGTVSAQSSKSANFAVTVNNPVSAGTTQISNQVTVSGSNFADETSNQVDTPLTTAPGLSLTKSDGGISATANTTIAYTLSYQNTGNIALDNVTLTDTVPANTTFNAGASTAGWVCAPDTSAGSICTLTIGTLNGGASSSATFAVTVASTLPSGTTQISNGAGIASGATSDTASDTTPLTGVVPNVSATKSADGSSFNPGDTITYTIVVSNSGVTSADNVTLTDPIPSNTTFVSGSVTIDGSTSPASNPASGVILGNISPGNSVTVTLQVLIDNPAPAGVTKIDNTGTVSGDNFTSAPTNTLSVTLTTTSALSLTKSDGGVGVAPNGTVTYTLGYQNTGNVALDNVTLTDTVPTNTVFNSGASTAGWNCTPNNNAGSTCTLNVGTLNGSGSGSANFAVTVASTVPVGTTQISNSAGIASGATTNSASDTTPLTGVAPVVTTTKTATDVNGGDLVPGDTLRYTITVSNSGTTDATSVIVSDSIPANTTYVANSTTVDGSPVADNAGAMPFVGGGSIGNIAPTDSVTVIFDVTVNNPVPVGTTQISNQATVSGGNFTTQTTDPATSALTTTSSLSLTKSDGDATVAPGGTVTYTLNYENTGNIALNNVTLTDIIPANATFNAGASTAGWICSPDSNAGSACTLNVGSLNGGASGSANFAVTVASTIPAGVTQIDNSAGIASGATTDSASDSTPLTGVAPSITASKTASDTNGGALIPGDTIEYTITVSNNGNTPALNVTLTDDIPANTIYVANSTVVDGSPAADNTGAMPFAGSGGSLGDITVGSSVTVVFQVTINNPLPSGVTEISNAGTVTGDNFSSTPTDTATSNVAVGLTISKAFATSHMSAGQTTNLRFTISNPATNPALTGLAFSDVLPNGLTFSGTPTAAQCGGTVILTNTFMLDFTGGTLASDATCTIDAVVKTDNNASGTLNNLSSIVTADGGIASWSGASASLSIDAGATPIPAQFFQCENLATQSGGSMTSAGGVGAVHSGDQFGNVYCHIIAKEGSFVTSSQEIGIESVLNLGVQQAVDVFGQLAGGASVVPFDRPVSICLRGAGEVLFLNAANAQRTVERLTAVDQNGYLCVQVTGSGTVVLVRQTSGAAPIPSPATPEPTGITLANCRVTTTQAPLNLRAEPGTSGAILDQLPYGITLTATERVPGWVRVIYLDGQGWVSETYLSFAGDCAQ